VSDERRRASDEHIAKMSEKLTKVTTMLEINFDPEHGHFTKQFTELKQKVNAHDDYVKYGKGALAVLSGLCGLGFAWLKTQIGAAK
jgi:hypothetical protein